MKRLLLKAFAAFSGLAWRRLERALESPRQTQLKTLKRLLRQARLAEPIADYERFKKLPLQSYDELEPRIQTAIDTGQHWLSRRKPFTHEPTSGSSGAKKLIPYTPALIRSFTHMFLCWAHDLLRYGPGFGGGRIYFSVSPQFHDTDYGLSDDSEYLSGPTAWIFRRFTLVPAAVKSLREPEDFLRVVSAHLLSADDLEVISVWSPSFLLSLLDYIQDHALELSKALQQGTVSGGGKVFKLVPVREAKIEALQTVTLNYPQLFPGLRLISCWGSHNAAVGWRELQARFPGVLVQAKGLLATEAPITIPSQKYNTFLPLLDEVFFEFIAEDGKIHLLDALKTDETYELVLTQASGLLRYRLGDLVKVTGRVKNTPCFDFVSRAGSVSDLVGEKLSEGFIAGIAAQFAGCYFCLVPDLDSRRYLLFADAPLDMALFETELMASPHYHNARKLNQLAPLELYVQPELASLIKVFYVEHRRMRLGDIKDRYLYSRENDGQLSRFLAG